MRGKEIKRKTEKRDEEEREREWVRELDGDQFKLVWNEAKVIFDKTKSKFTLSNFSIK